MRNTQKIINYKPSSVPSPYVHLHFQKLCSTLLKRFALFFAKLVRKMAAPEGAANINTKYTRRIFKCLSLLSPSCAGNNVQRYHRHHPGFSPLGKRVSTGRRREFPSFSASVSQHTYHQTEFYWLLGPCTNEKKKELLDLEELCSPRKIWINSLN